MELCLDGQKVGHGLVFAFGPPFKRFNNSLRLGGSQRIPRPRPSSFLTSPDIVPKCEQNGVTKNSTQGYVSWANSFEKLLEDPVGLQTFTEFLKKEFSAENIEFWIACDRYRKLPLGPEKKNEALRIYQQHLCPGAPEGVNVDVHGRQCAEHSLQDADSNIFDQAQKQIFNLMKFDSYPRFLKSDLYKQQCFANSEKTIGKSLSSIITPTKLKKSHSNAEDRRRKSMLPWHKKNRSKSKDRIDTETFQKYSVGSKSNSEHMDTKSGSLSSLTSLDLAATIGPNLPTKTNQEDISTSGSSRTVLCRVSLGNDSTTVVQIRQSETIQQLVQRLLDKRGLNYSSYEVSTNKHSKPLDVSEASSKLAGCEVKIQQRVVFKLDLPNKKIVSVKSKSTKMIVEVIKPILHKYEYSLDQVCVYFKENIPILDVYQPITTIDGLKLQIQLREGQKSNGSIPCNNKVQSIKGNRLVEITNQVFEGILQEKVETAHLKPKSDRGSVKSEDCGSEHSSGLLGKILRRDSGVQECKKKSFIPRYKVYANTQTGEEGNSEKNQLKKPLIAKWKTGVNKLQVSPCSESDELVEGLTRAQQSRLEDQRGTEINSELPDFLKDTENEQNLIKYNQHSSDAGTGRQMFGYPCSPTRIEKNVPATGAKSMKLDTESNYENRNIINESTNINQPNKLHQVRIYSPSKLEIVPKSSQFSPAKLTSNAGKSEVGNEPPPLPPKPKVIPLKPPNWGQNGFYKPRDLTSKDSVCPEGSLFLEQPSSSFV